MKSFLTASIAAIVMSVPAMAAPTLGEVAPDFTAPTTSGETITLSEMEGTVVLEWTNHGCPFVKKHYNSGNMQATQQAALEDGATWITIVSSAEGKQGYVSAKEANELSTSRNATPTHVVLDPSGDIGRLYKAKTTPHMFVIEDKNVVYAGAIDSIPSGDTADIEKAENYVLSALANIEAGEEVATPVSQPYGCNVKYGS